MAVTDSKSGIRNPAFMILLSCFAIVSLVFAAVDFAAAACTRNVPSVIFSPTNSYIVGTSGTKVYKLTILNNDKEDFPTECGSSTFTLSIASETGNTASFSLPSALGSTSTGALAVGARYNTTLTVTTALGITEGHKITSVVQAVDGTNHSGKTGKGSAITKATAFKGDGNLLKRSEEETCHVCHKTDRNRTPSDSDWNDAIKMHSSKSLASNKWSASGGWGVAGGKYGEFGCTTCHIEHSTKNIYLMRETITTPDGSNFEGRGTNSVTVDFRYKTTQPAGTAGTFGDDSDTVGHASSSRICEVCHSYDSAQTTGVNKHAYNMSTASPQNPTHYNAQECTTCHDHKKSFSGGGCTGCHGNPPVAASIGGPSGLASPATGATSPLSPGAHNAHVTTRSMICNACHTGNTMPTVSNTIQMGFVSNSTNYPGWGSTAVTTGSFDGHTPLNATYTFVSSNGGTTVTTSASYANTCSSLYCHGGGTTGTTALTGGSNQSPSWVGGSSQATCGTCHGGSGYAVSTATPPTTGKHTTHASSTTGNLGLACNKCHNSTSNMSHVNGNVAWSLDTADSRIGSSATYKTSASGTTGGLAPSASYGNCENLYCHSNGKVGTSVGAYTTPAWSGADITCNSCHGTTTAAGTPDYANEGAGTVGANSHSKHTGTGISTCVYCHSTTTTTGTTITGTVHIDNTRDVSSGGGKTFSYAAPNCSTISCHGGNGAQWGATLSCISCHGGNAASGSAITLGSHTKHINNAGAVGTTYRCAECHNTTVSSTSDEVITGPSNHADGTKTVSLRLGGTWGSNQCSTNYCHGTVSPTWGADTSTTSCEKCHGSAASATSGTFKITAQTTGTAPSVIHVSHLASSHNYSSDITCTQCHTVPGITETTGHIDTALPAEVPMGGALAGTGGLTPGYDSGTKTCSTFYCHGYSLSSNTPTLPSSVDVDPTWTATFLTGSSTVGNGNDTPGSGDCSKCHAYPPMNGASGTHTGKIATDCTTCHTHVNAGGTGFGDVTKHINGSVEGGTCDSCHSYDVVAGSWGTNPKSVEGYGAHARHITHIKTRFSVTLTAGTDTFGAGAAAQVCGTCHTNASAAHSTGGGGTRTINFGDSRYKEGSTDGTDGFSFVFGSSSPSYSGVVGNSSSVNPKSCSNIGCHYQTTPVWSSY